MRELSKQKRPNLLFWMLFGALSTVLVVGAYRAFIIIQGGHSLTSPALLDLLFEVMQLHHWAAIGGVVGVTAGLIERGLLIWKNRAREPVPNDTDAAIDPDAKIRELRAKRAEEYLAQREHEITSPIEHVIRAKEGELTYRVLAYQDLSERECMELVWKALQDGRLKEPKPGETATLVTAIGRKT